MSRPTSQPLVRLPAAQMGFLGFRHGIQSWLFLPCPQVIAFMKSPVGQYLDRHPFMALTVLVFVAMSAIPVGFFVLIVVLTSLAAFVGVILLEGIYCSSLHCLGKCFSWEHSIYWVPATLIKCSCSWKDQQWPRQIVSSYKMDFGLQIRIVPSRVRFWTIYLPSLNLKIFIYKLRK